MSTYWDLYCVTCEQDGNVFHWNHGEEELLGIVKALPVIAALAPFVEIGRGYALRLRVDYGPEWQRDLIEFAATHRGHDVKVRSEYGEFYTGLSGAPEETPDRVASAERKIR